MILSVIVPCFNEEKVIEETYRRLSLVLNDTSTVTKHELLFINDGSSDQTFEKLARIAQQDHSVKVISFSRNFGHQPAVTAGLNHCMGDYALVIDADLQDPPEMIPPMIELALNEKANVVYGVRKERKGEGIFKKTTASYFYRMLNNLSEVKIPVDTGDFRLIDRKVIDQFNQLKEKNKYIRGLISWVGFKQVPFYYEREARFAGETKYPLKKMIRFASIGVFYFSKKPLRLATSLGFLSIVMGLFMATWIIINRLLHPEYLITGWASLILVIIFFGGVQLLTIGVLGQYIGSLFDEAKQRPEYIVETKINF